MSALRDNVSGHHTKATILALVYSVRKLTPSFVVEAYHRFRRDVLRADIHATVSRVTISHINRYLHANAKVDGMSVLDAASGSGYGSMLLSRATTYRGIDLDQRAVDEARREFPEFDFDSGSVYDLPYETGEFDAVISFETLEHVNDPLAAMNELARVLRPGGRLIGSIPIDHPDRVYHFKPYSITEARNIFKSCSDLASVAMFRQTQSVIVAAAEGDFDEWPGGTLLAELERV